MPRTSTSAISFGNVQVNSDERYVRITRGKFVVLIPVDIATEVADLIVDEVERRQ